MKQRLIFVLGFLAFCVLASFGQPVFMGMTPEGGDGAGAIFRLDAGTNTMIPIHKFKRVGYQPAQYSAPLIASNGRHYGMTTYGGKYGYGVIYELDPLNNFAYNELHQFNYTNGANPYGSLLEGSNGKLYGLTSQGGVSGQGVAFSLDPANGNTFSILHQFNGTNGAYPYGSLMEGSNGKLYGLTSQGGASGRGVAFSLDPANGNAFSILHQFNSTNGANPTGSLEEGGNGKLYGLTVNGGASGRGVAFSLDPANGNTFSILHQFNSTIGASPRGSLVEGSNGKLYGLTTHGGATGHGIAFSLDPANGNAFSILHQFNSTNGANPYGSLVEGSNGKLYGLTVNGGTSGHGVTFSLDPANSNAFSILHQFNSTNGANPYGSLVEGSNGKLYGLTNSGGASGRGVAFSLDPANGNAFTILHQFNATNGDHPYGSLLEGSNGKLYGLTSQGGVSGQGVVFSLDPANGNAFSILHQFNSTNGAYPYGSLVEGSNGKLYGLTSHGGASGHGVAFSLDPANGNAFTILHQFNYTNGANPYGGLVEGSNGKLYGLTFSGGASGQGVAFSLDPANGHAYSILHQFDYTNGAYPYGSLVEGSNGKLYGLTSEGGAGLGVAFSLDPANGNAFSILHQFKYTNGAYPHGSLVQGSNGKLYGLTYSGGVSGRGVAFSLDPANGHAFSILHQFNSTNGSNPYGSLVEASNGKLYGLTRQGGISGYGVAFSLDPTNGNLFTKLADFDYENGTYPFLGAALLEIGGCSSPDANASNAGPLCIGESIELSASGGQSYLWSGPNDFSSTEQNPVIHNVIAEMAGIYSVTVSNGPNCSATATTTVVVNALPDPEVLADGPLDICPAASVNLTAVNGVSWAWNNGATTQSIPVNSAGSYSVEITDVNGCKAVSTEQVITISDTEPPSFDCPINPDVIIDANCSIVIPDLVSSLTGTDNCGSVQFSQLPLAGTIQSASHGVPIPVTITADDGNGNTSSCIVGLNPIDQSPPTLTLPDNLTVNNDPGQCGAVVDFDIEYSDNCTGLSFEKLSGLEAGQQFPVGTTTNSYRVTDGAGLVTNASFTVTVVDNQDPVFTCTTYEYVFIRGNCSIVVPDLLTGLSGTDNCGSVVFSQLPLAGTIIATAHGENIQVTIRAEDENANSRSCVVTLRVLDITYPVLTLPENILVNNAEGACGQVVDFNVFFSDNCGGSQLQQTAGIAAGESFPVGTTTNTYRVTDAAGLITTASFTVTVVDNIPPTITAPSTIILNADAGACGITNPDLGIAVADDNCGVATIVNNADAYLPVGDHTITWTVKDLNGLTTSADQLVTVVDNQSPVARTKNITVALSEEGNAVILPESVDNNSSDNCAIVSWSVSPYLFNCNNLGDNTVTLTVRDAAGLSHSANATVTVTGVQTTSSLTVNPTEQQYSDVVDLRATLSPAQVLGGCQPATHVSFKIGTLVLGTVPLSVDGNTLVGELNANLLEELNSTELSPGNKTITAEFSHSDYNGNTHPAFVVADPTTPLSILAEDARVEYIGSLSVGTSCTTCSQAAVTLSATVIDISASADAAGDNDPGDIRKALVRFINRDNGAPLTGWLTPGLVDVSDTRVGTVTANWNVDIGSLDANDYTIGVEVAGYYTRNHGDDNVIVNIAKPVNKEFATGGGYIRPTASAGKYAAKAGTKNNFGFNALYNKSGRSLQGKLNLIFRRMETDGNIHVYQLKGNNLTQLRTNTRDPLNRTALIDGRANMVDITNPLAPVAVASNLALQISVTDKGEPGTSDQIAITAQFSSGGLAYSSNWSGTRTNETILGGGNILVHGSSSTKATTIGIDPKIASVADENIALIVKVMPNPTASQFLLNIRSNGEGDIHLRVTDLLGRSIETLKLEGVSQSVKIGSAWSHGMYFLEVLQGKQRQTIKLIKAY